MSEAEAVTVTELRADHGTVVVFEADTDDGRSIWFGADRRPAQLLVEELAAGRRPRARVEGWQVLAEVSA